MNRKVLLSAVSVIALSFGGSALADPFSDSVAMANIRAIQNPGPITSVLPEEVILPAVDVTPLHEAVSQRLLNPGYGVDVNGVATKGENSVAMENIDRIFNPGASS